MKDDDRSWVGVAHRGDGDSGGGGDEHLPSPIVESGPAALAQRRMRVLCELVQHAGQAHSLEACLRLAAAVIVERSTEVPVVLCYALDEEGGGARLVAQAGLTPGQDPERDRLDLPPPGAWPLAEALAAGRPIPMDDVQARVPGLFAGSGAEPVRCAYALPILASSGRASAVVIAGVDPRLTADEACASFHTLLAASLTGLVANATAVDAERGSAVLAKQRKETADRLAEASRELEAFSYSISHDLRSPLRAIDGFSRVLLSDHSEGLNEEGRRYLERIRAGTQRMAVLIDDLLSLSRIARAPMRCEQVDLTALARRILGELAAREPQRRIDWTVAAGLQARGDRRSITVLLEHLLGNAWKFTSKRAHARIEVGSELREGETVFVVRDDGAGFAMEYAKRLFAPFQRLHSASEFQGTGIGLATVHRVVTRHAGRVWAESAPDRGATFFFTLGEPP